MPSKVAQQVIIGIVALVGFVLAVVTSPGHAAGALSATPLRLYSISVTVVGLAFIAYDRWLWRWPVVRRGRPRLAGTWRGTLTSNYVAPGGQAFTNLRTHLLIRQTFTTVTVTLLTDRSQSESGGATLRCAPDGRWHLSWTYANIPRPSERAVSEPHRGACELIVAGHDGDRLEGSYYTDRLSRGELAFDLWSPHFYGDAAGAAAATDFARHPSTA